MAKKGPIEPVEPERPAQLIQPEQPKRSQRVDSGIVYADNPEEMITEAKEARRARHERRRVGRKK